ncbi:hypothetical protein NLU13_6450 [Sarocladium strictum]|uniref:Bromo domain-containing protein n=1 Tax=Sarocladium strictum TaxID=5046 RepID=A0AA39L7B1_SARSR|nr:hypothetical protein NLU13_6450 [Sarocladium strictum]
MSSPATYTPLESLLLFQSLLAQGVDGPAFARVSEILKNHPLIRAEATYNPARLTADALQQLFLVLWQEELKAETERAINNDASLSPNTKKRKLENPPLPTLSDTYEHINKLPGLVDRLYTRYRAHIVKELRDEEQRFARVKREVTLLERNERQRLASLAEQQKAASASPVGQAAKPTGTSTQTPVAVAPKRPTSTTPVFPPRPPTANIAPANAHASPNLPPHAIRPSHSPQPPLGVSPVLQAPPGAQQPTPQSLHAPPHVPRPSISPRPEAAGRGKPTAVASPSPYPKPVPTPAGQAQQYPQQPPRLQPSPSPHPPVQPRPPQKATPGHPQHAGQVVPPLQAAPPRPSGAPPLAQPQARPTSTTPVHPPTRPLQPQQTQVQVPRPLASASPTPPPAAAGAVPPPKWPSGQLPATGPQQAAPATPGIVTPKPAVVQAPRPAIPEHMIRHAATPNSARRTSSGPPAAPSTPVVQSPSSVTRGFGTKWAPHSTPSTPGPLVAEPESPAFEPVSPPARGAVLPPREPMKLTLPADLAGKVNKARASKTAVKSRAVSNMRTRRSMSVASHTDEMSIDHSEQERPIKDEDVTPRPRDETGDTTADESVQDRRQSVRTPSSVSSRVPKRKRQETPPEPPTKQTHVMWTRGFTKVSSSVLDRISSHRDANMFAKPLGERDAPNYRGVVLQPQDFASIRAAIKNGNKAASTAAGNLPGGDPGSPNVWLPIAEDLVPPKAIINSAQLERELVHMFCNAIMYNPDPNRGPGPHFLRRSQDEGEEIVGYQLDENGVVRNTRSMFLEVEKLLGELRSAEKGRGSAVPPPSATRPGSSVAATPAGDDTADDEDELAGDTDPPSTSGTIKRRRLGVRG